MAINVDTALTEYNKTMADLIKDGSLYKTSLDRFLGEMSDFGLTPEEKANSYIQYITQADGQLHAVATQLVELSRKLQGFDDNMLMELSKMQGNVASFFVNSNPSGAQSVLDDLKNMMQIVSKRADEVTGTQPQIPT